MSKKLRAVSQNRRSSSGSQYTVKRSKDGKIVVRGHGVRTTGTSVRRAKTLAKALARYRSNVKFIAENSKKETASASSVSKKSQKDLEDKYKYVNTK